MELVYIITETKGPDSFDPMDADKTQNLSVMRMLYATPVEVDRNNVLKSKILKTFTYIQDRKEIIFEVRDDQKYSDDTSITAEDVALSIARVAYFRPKFPVIKDIKGVANWSELKKGLHSLPPGIKVEGRKVIITLDEASANPLFRFCLELFSVIPSACIDRDQGKVICRKPPSSGYFTLKEESAGGLVFEKRKTTNSVDPIHFEIVRFDYKTLSEACKLDLKPNEIVSGAELDYLTTECSKYLSVEQIHWMPAARFGILRFNPNVKPFSDGKLRKFFSETVRNTLKKTNKKLLIERGLFSALLPGYLDSDKLPVDMDPALKESFRGIRIVLPKVEHSSLKIIFDAIIAAALDLEMDVELLQDLSADNLTSKFLSGEVSVVAGASGFWAQDPIGDLSMWFTPNLHKTMTFVWTDKKIYEDIASLEREEDVTRIRDKMEAFNKYVSDQSILAPVIHFRRLFISSKQLKNMNLPQAVTSPAPWQLHLVN